jgi:hypothetical protein
MSFVNEFAARVVAFNEFIFEQTGYGGLHTIDVDLRIGERLGIPHFGYMLINTPGGYVQVRSILPRFV